MSEVDRKFSVAKNQSNAWSVAVIAAVAGVVGSMVYRWATERDIPDLPSKDVIVFIVSGGIGYGTELVRDAWRFLGWPLFRDWYKKRFGKEPDMEGE